MTLNNTSKSENFHLIKELIGSAMYFASTYEYRLMVEDKVQKNTGWDKVQIVEFDSEKKNFVDHSPEGIGGILLKDFYPYESPFIQQMISSTGSYIRNLTGDKLEHYELKLMNEGFSTLCLSPILPREHFAGVVMGLARDKENLKKSDFQILEIAAEVVALATQIFRGNRLNTNLNQKVEDYHDQMIRLESLKIMGELTAGAAGDLNNILTGVLGSLELIGDEIEDPEMQEILQAVEQSVKSGKETVQNLQEFKKVDTDQDYQVITVQELIERAIQLTHSKWLDEAMARSVEYKIETDIARELSILGNPTALLVATILIIFKQIERIPVGGKITIEAVPVGETAQITFRANLAAGPEGILTDLDPFIHRREGSQFSLNLSAAEEILRRHQGTFTQESIIGTGTTIRIKLPLHSTPETRGAIGANQNIITCEKAKSARILVVEDEPVVRQLLEDMLEVEGFCVDSVESGPKGLAMLKKIDFDLIITDLGMPVMSGLDFTLRAREMQPKIPVIMATGWESRIDRKKLKDYKIDHVVGKPFQFRKLIEAINSLLCSGS